jgi:hypothetical protein
MPSMVIGWVLITAGLVLVVLGVIGAAVQVLRSFTHLYQVKGPAETIGAIDKLIQTLSKAPYWLSFIVVGVFLVWYGSSFVFPR